MKVVWLLVLVFVASAFTGSDVKLEYVFKVGDEYVWKQQMHQTVKQSIPIMGDQLIESRVNVSLNLKVTSLTPTGAKIETKYTAMSMQSKMPAGMGDDMMMDSEGAADKIENKMLKALMNKAFTLTITKQGKVEKVEGLENLWTEFNGLQAEGQQLAVIKRRIQQNLSEGSVKISFENALMRYPEQRVKPGDTWDQKAGVPGIFPLEMKNTWSVTNIAADAIKLTSDGIISTTDKQKVVELPNGLKSKVDLNGAQKLFGTVNPKTGWPTDVKMMSEIKGNMTLIAGGMIPQDILVPMEIVTENNYTIAKK